MPVSERLPVKVVPVGGDGEPIPQSAETLEGIADGIGAAADAANDPTVIGLLKQVIIALGEVKTAIESTSG